MGLSMTVVLVLYRKAEQTRYFPALSQSLIKHGHTKIVLVTYDGHVDEAGIELFRTSPGVDLTRVTVDRDRDRDPGLFLDGSDLSLDNPALLLAWSRGVEVIPSGHPFVALDVATLILRPLDEVVPRIQPRHYTLALAQGLTATGRPRYLPGVLYGVGGPIAVNTMDSCCRECRSVMNRGDRTAIERTYGSALSAAYVMAKSKADEGGGAVFGTIPRGWITSDERPSDEAGIVRFVDVEGTVR